MDQILLQRWPTMKGWLTDTAKTDIEDDHKIKNWDQMKPSLDDELTDLEKQRTKLKSGKTLVQSDSAIQLLILELRIEIASMRKELEANDVCRAWQRREIGATREEMWKTIGLWSQYKDRMTKCNQDLEEQIIETNSTMDFQDMWIQMQSDKLDEKKSRIAEMGSKISEFQDEIAQMNSMIESLEDENRRLKGSISKRPTTKDPDEDDSKDNSPKPDKQGDLAKSLNEDEVPKNNADPNRTEAARDPPKLPDETPKERKNSHPGPMGPNLKPFFMRPGAQRHSAQSTSKAAKKSKEKKKSPASDFRFKDIEANFARLFDGAPKETKDANETETNRLSAVSLEQASKTTEDANESKLANYDSNKVNNSKVQGLSNVPEEAQEGAAENPIGLKTPTNGRKQQDRAEEPSTEPERAASAITKAERKKERRQIKKAEKGSAKEEEKLLTPQSRAEARDDPQQGSSIGAARNRNRNRNWGEGQDQGQGP